MALFAFGAFIIWSGEFFWLVSFIAGVYGGVISDLYYSIEVSDFNIAAAGHYVRNASKILCAVTCTFESNCMGFQMVQERQCFMIVKRTWSEKKTEKQTLWIKRRNENTLCNKSTFEFSLSRSRYHLVLEHDGDWDMAADICVKRSGKLAQITTNAERVFVRKIIANNGGPEYTLLGHHQKPGSDEPKHGWIWHLSNDSVSMNEFWNEYQPNDLGNEEHWGNINRNNGLFADGNGNDKAFVCECFII